MTQNPEEQASGETQTQHGVSRRTFLMVVPSVLTAATLTSCGVGQVTGIQLNPPTAYAANPIDVDPSIRYQTIEGWGTSLAWWANVIGGWPDSERNNMVDLMFDASKGLGLNIARYNIGGGDDPAHQHMRDGGAVPGFKASASADYDWTADANQRWVLLAAKKRGVNLFEAFSNSPPYWMTNSGCAGGSTNGKADNLARAYYDAFADYLTEVVRQYRDNWDVTFRTLEPFNESSAHWWKAYGKQEGCHFDRGTQNTIIAKVGASLVDKGLTETTVSASDENSLDDAVTTYNSYNSTALSYVTQVNSHSYNGSERTQLYDLAIGGGKRLWMSEFGEGAGSTLDDIAGGLALSARILDDMRNLRPSAWIYWQGIEAAEYKSSWGFIHTAYNATTYKYTIAKQYYTMAQYSKFMRPGATIISINDAKSLAAYDATSQTLVIVTTNPNALDMSVNYNLSKFTITGSVTAYRTSASENLASVSGAKLSGSSLISTSPTKSITTYIISGVSYLLGSGSTPGLSNLITNPGFETGSLSPWLGEWHPVLAGVEKHYAHAKTYDAYLHPTSTKDVAIYQTLSAPATRSYTLTAYAATNVANAAQMGVDVAGKQAAHVYVTANVGYKRYTLTFQAVAGQVIKVWYYANRTQGWATLDDVSLT